MRGWKEKEENGRIQKGKNGRIMEHEGMEEDGIRWKGINWYKIGISGDER